MSEVRAIDANALMDVKEAIKYLKAYDGFKEFKAIAAILIDLYDAKEATRKKLNNGSAKRCTHTP
jgi:hypothetical protein